MKNTKTRIKTELTGSKKKGGAEERISELEKRVIELPNLKNRRKLNENK